MAINFLYPTNTRPEIQINDTDDNPRLAFLESDVVSGGISTTGGNLVFETSSGTERARILSGGNFGIDNTDPKQKLSVAGIINSDSNEDYYGAWLSGNSTAGSQNYLGLGVWYSEAGYVRYFANDRLSIYTYDATEDVTLQEAGGKVGIGTSTPDTKFNVTDGGTQVAISNTYLAHLQSASNCGLAITAGASSNNYIAFGDSDNYDEGIINYNNSTRSFAFRTADGTLDDLVINSAGDVGIGNNSPNHRLDVTGDIYSSGQMLTKGSDFASFTVLGDLDTGLGNFNAAGRVSLVSDGKPEITVDQATIAFDNYTATAVATTGSLIPNQSNQALTEDTLANICVDPDGNVVRGSQEGTWTFTKAQLDALATTTSGGTQLIQAPGANKAVVVEESNWMIKYSGTGSMSNNGFEIRQSTVVLADAGISRIPSGKINEIMNSAQGTPTNPSYGFYARDLPQYNNDARTYKTNAQTVLMRINTNATPANLVSISIKLKYRLFDATTF